MLQSRRARYALLGACLLMIPTTALAQEGTIAGTVRDEQGGALPGVTVEATSPALIGVRTTVSDGLGQYRITNLPIGTYTVVFTLSGFQRQQRDNVVLTSGFTANVNPALGVGNFQETVVVMAESPVVDVQNARQAITFSGDGAAGAADVAQHRQPAVTDARESAPAIGPVRHMASATAAWGRSAARPFRASTREKSWAVHS